MEFFVAYAIRKSSLLPCTTDATLKEDFDVDESISSWSLLHESFVSFAVKLGWSNVLKFKDKIDPSKNRHITTTHLKKNILLLRFENHKNIWNISLFKERSKIFSSISSSFQNLLI